jgi:hypothetical protein
MVVAKTEQIVTDRKTLRRTVEFMEEAVKEGLTRVEITSQIDLMHDKAAQKRLKQSLKEVKEGRVRRFNNPEELMIKYLHAPD